jgi:putative ABC transport system permease protein
VTLPQAKYDSPARRLTFYEALEDRLKTLPSVAAVGLGQGIPFSGWNVQSGMMAKGWPPPKPGQEFDTHYQFVSPTFFQTMGVTLERGRWLTDADRDTANPVGLVNATFARRVFPNEDPLGKQVRVGDADSKSPWVTIVGVIQDYRHYRLPQPMGPGLYFPEAIWPPATQTAVIRVRSGDPAGVMPAVRDVLRDLDADMPPYSIKTFEQAVASSLWRQRFQGLVVAVFAALALLLAAVGIYGVVSYSVAQRTREFGVRVALGAQVNDVLGLVLRHGIMLAVQGVVLGLLGGAILTRYLTTLLYDTQPRDPLVFGGVALGLGAVAIVAVSIPAWRATSVDPLVAMRPD